MLLNGTSGGAIDWSRSANFETVGDAKSTQFSPYSGSYYSVNFATQATENSIKTSGANVSLGSGNFTVECWVNQTGSSDGRAVFMIGTSSNALALYQYGATQLGIAGYAPAGTNVFASTGLATFTLGAWDHHAIVRNNGTVTWYKNGVSIYSVANSTNFTQTGASIGYWAATGGWLGYISNLRVVVGTAVYTTAFTPPTGPLTAISGTQLLACQSNKFIENSSNNYALTVTGTPLVVTQNPFQQNTGKSLYFDGTGDYLTAPYNIQYQMVNEDFTIEAWVYRNVVGAEHNIAVTRSSASSDGWNVRINSSNTLQFYFTGGGSVTSTGTIPAGVWTYITVVKSGNTAKLYINGVNDGTNAAIGTGTANSQALRIGVDNSNAAGYMNGYISDLRITKGVARYSTTFTPPTTPDQLI